MARTRIAPSPTGEDLHIGNAYTALINFVVASQSKGQFIVRIEDTDRSRFVEGSEEHILASLLWLGIVHDEGPQKGGSFAPYRQSDNLALYQKKAEELVAKDHAYYCFCTPERLAEVRKKLQQEKKPPGYDRHCRHLDAKEVEKKRADEVPHTIRLKVPESGTTTFTDAVRGDVSFENALIGDQVLLKSDGYPTYHLAVVIDDHRMEISHIIRGEEWISSTPKHVMLYAALGWKLPVFAHMPLLRNPDKSKLSKRKNPVWVSWYKNEGFLPEAVVNYLGTLAWAYPDGKEIFSVKEMADVFDLKDVQTTAPVFNLEKLMWVNGQYIKNAKSKNLKAKIWNYLDEQKVEGYDKNAFDELFEKIDPLIRERMKTLKEFDSLARFFFHRPTQFAIPKNDEVMQILTRALKDCAWNHDAMEAAVRTASDTYNRKAREVFMELRVAVTGQKVGPPLLPSLEILGREETLARLVVEKH